MPRARKSRSCVPARRQRIEEESQPSFRHRRKRVARSNASIETCTLPRRLFSSAKEVVTNHVALRSQWFHVAHMYIAIYMSPFRTQDHSRAKTQNPTTEELRKHDDGPIGKTTVCFYKITKPLILHPPPLPMIRFRTCLAKSRPSYRWQEQRPSPRYQHSTPRILRRRRHRHPKNFEALGWSRQSQGGELF